jgi:hypothetical protein
MRTIPRQVRPRKYRSGDVFETAALSAVAGFRIASQRLRFAGKPVGFIVAGTGVAGQKIFRLNPAQTEDFANLLLRQAIFPVAFQGERFERETLRVSVSGARQSPSDFIRDFERQNHVLPYRASAISHLHFALQFVSEVFEEDRPATPVFASCLPDQARGLSGTNESPFSSSDVRSKYGISAFTARAAGVTLFSPAPFDQATLSMHQMVTLVLKLEAK